MTEIKWSATLTQRVGQAIKERRKELGISARELASGTREQGEEVPQAVITNLETGRREGLSVAELTLLSGALGVAPLELLFPTRSAGTEVEWLPGRRASNYDAREAFAGLDADPAGPEGDYLTIRGMLLGELETVRLISDAVADRKAEKNTQAFPWIVKLIWSGVVLSKSTRRLLDLEGFILPEPIARMAELHRLPDDPELAQRNIEMLVISQAAEQ